MKSTGIIRRIDKLGRVMLPAGLRRTMDIKTSDDMEFFVDGDAIILKKYSPVCVFCDSGREIVRFKEKMICAKCLRQLKASPEPEGDPLLPED